MVIPPSFADSVYRALRRVPKSSVTTYAALARAVGKPRAARAVGNALNKNPFSPLVPCHRVVRSDGRVGGFASGTRKKAALLVREGVQIRHRKIDLKNYAHPL